MGAAALGRGADKQIPFPCLGRGQRAALQILSEGGFRHHAAVLRRDVIISPIRGGNVLCQGHGQLAFQPDESGTQTAVRNDVGVNLALIVVAYLFRKKEPHARLHAARRAHFIAEITAGTGDQVRILRQEGRNETYFQFHAARAEYVICGKRRYAEIGLFGPAYTVYVSQKGIFFFLNL